MGICSTEDGRTSPSYEELAKVQAILEHIHTGYGDKYAADFCNKDYTSEKEISSALEADLALVVPLPCARVIYQHYHAPAPAAKVPPLNLEELPEQGGSEGQRKEGDKRRAVDDELESSEGEPVTPGAEATQRTPSGTPQSVPRLKLSQLEAPDVKVTPEAREGMQRRQLDDTHPEVRKMMVDDKRTH
eukprot:TRINITY_DN3272_c0_g1_i2.p1 TRINITY_DN3272_c0_g1~~TRINITY_DN3272_c0_g1_i2.p1  ORF type:complete len:188 (+),score=37.91 TRINITY_DN3272_c0_g1_i2:186-749(+)